MLSLFIEYICAPLLRLAEEVICSSEEMVLPSIFTVFIRTEKTNIKTSASAAAANQNFIINAFMRNDASSVLLIYFLLCDERKQIAV